VVNPGRRRTGPLVWAAVAAAAVLAGCSNQTVRDLEGVPVREPDKSEIYVNVDQFANVARECIDGVAFAFTSRDYAPILRVPEWDDWCAR
jgi:hypothetical protein